MDPLSLAALLVVAFIVGGLVGCTGVGGVMIVPAMTFLIGIEPHAAIAAALFSYIFSGITTTAVHARRKSIQWPVVFLVWSCTAPAALAGAFLVWAVPGTFLLAGIGVLTLVAAGRALIPSSEGEQFREITPGRLGLFGAIAGFGSSLTGTGGPIIMIPLLVWARVSPLPLLGLAQSLQVPIAILATIANLIVGEVNFALGAVNAVGLIFGVIAGTRLAYRLPVATLRQLIAWVLILLGLFMIGQIAYEWLMA